MPSPHVRCTSCRRGRPPRDPCTAPGARGLPAASFAFRGRGPEPPAARVRQHLRLSFRFVTSMFSRIIMPRVVGCPSARVGRSLLIGFRPRVLGRTGREVTPRPRRPRRRRVFSVGGGSRGVRHGHGDAGVCQTSPLTRVAAPRAAKLRGPRPPARPPPAR